METESNESAGAGAVASPYGKATVIVGPGWIPGGQTIEELMAAGEIDHEILRARGDVEASELAREAVSTGARYLVAVGSDWDLHQIVSGLMSPEGPINPEVVLAVIPSRTGSDFLRTFGLSSSPADAVRHFAGEAFFSVDVGRVTFDSDPASPRWIINLAQAGIGAEASRRAGSLPSFLGRAGKLLGFWGSLGFFKLEAAKIVVDRRTYQGPVTNVVVGNGQFYRDGIRVAVKAHPADGKFDVLIQKGTKRDYIESITRSFKGLHLPSPLIREYLASQVRIESEHPMPVEIDGRVVGETPATFEIVANAYRLKI
jgi:diacylglycerol kinase (ATP)